MLRFPSQYRSLPPFFITKTTHRRGALVLVGHVNVGLARAVAAAAAAAVRAGVNVRAVVHHRTGGHLHA